MPKLPNASGDKHVAAFKRAGWKVNHIEGSHNILVKEGGIHLSIPVHKGKLITRAGLTNEEYVDLFYGKNK